MPNDDTNRRVAAEACGFEVRIDQFGFLRIVATWKTFNPFWSHADAVLAAEKFGLFDDEKHERYMRRIDAK